MSRPRWIDDRLWFCDWVAHEIIALDLDGTSEVMLRVDFPSMPMSIDQLPDGRVVVVSSSQGLLLTLEPDGTLAPYADLSAIATGYNEIVVDGRGNSYVNGGGFNLMAGEEFKPGIVALVTPDGSSRQVADGIAFGNGMAVTPDNSTLIVAESYGKRLTAFDIDPDGGLSGRRVWADLGEGTPDGICIDAEGAVWYADVPHQCCVRVREGGEVLQTVTLDRGGFACMLGGPDRQTLFIVATEWRGIAGAEQADPHRPDPDPAGAGTWSRLALSRPPRAVRSAPEPGCRPVPMTTRSAPRAVGHCPHQLGQLDRLGPGGLPPPGRVKRGQSDRAWLDPAFGPAGADPEVRPEHERRPDRDDDGANDGAGPGARAGSGRLVAQRAVVRVLGAAGGDAADRRFGDADDDGR